MELRLARKVVGEETFHMEAVVGRFFQPVFETTLLELRRKLAGIEVGGARRKAENLRYCVKKAEVVFEKYLQDYKKRRVWKY